MKNNKYTHELRFNAKKIYPMKVLELSNVINKDFEEITNIRIAYLPDGTKLLEVSGKVSLYGFKVENGGFFDLINGVYYDENNFVFKNGTIVERKNNSIQRRLKQKHS